MPTKNRELQREMNRRSYHKHKASRNAQKREYMLQRDYGVSVAEYDTMREKQGHKCAICGTHESDLKRALSVDHCHTTGVVRGLLCDSCNLGIGKLRDSAAMLRAAASYLDQYSGGSE